MPLAALTPLHRARPRRTSPRVGYEEALRRARDCVPLLKERAQKCEDARPSTAWNVGNLGCHHWILGYYEPRTQHRTSESSYGAA